MECDPEGAERDEAEGLREPLIGHAGLRRQRPGQMPRAFATQRGEDRRLLGGSQVEQLADFGADGALLLPEAPAYAAS